MRKKNIWFELGIHLLIIIMIVPAILFACLLTIKNMLIEFPDDIYKQFADNFYEK